MKNDNLEQFKIICVIGTRPEAIKMAPVVKALRNIGFEVRILATAQHRFLLDQVLSVFGLHADWDLDAMRTNQNLSELLARLLPELEQIIRRYNPDVVLAQGDTTTVLASALAAYHAGVAFGHVEAGLRSGNLCSPFPEEGNRRLVAVLAKWHFAPTSGSAEALYAEGVTSSQVYMVGNTVIDALLEVAKRPDLPWPNKIPRPSLGERWGLITLHRRENFGPTLNAILNGVKTFAHAHPEARFIYPLHPNPNASAPAREILGDVPNIFLTEPLDYPTLVNVLCHTYAIFTDSGGLQEEGPALGKPVLVFREVTERPESVVAGGAILVGGSPERFLLEANRLWEDQSYYLSVAIPRFIYGDGHAAVRIAKILAGSFANK